jgi:NitT/TauT family transport system substrate-binding protein
LLALVAACAPAPARPAAPPPASPPAAPAQSAAGSTTAAAPAPPAAAASGAAPAQASAALAPLSPPLDVKIGVQSSVSDGGLYIALAKGYFREVGINASVEVFSAGAADYVQFIATNQLQAGGPSSVPALYNAAERGANLTIVADKGKLSPGFGFLRLTVRKDLHDSGEVRGLQDLKGRTIAIASPYGAAHSLAALSLRKIGFADGDTNIIPVPNPDHIAALANRAVDAAISLEPIPTRAVQQGVAVILAEGEALRPNSQAGMLALSPQLHQNRDAALRFVVAYLRGVRAYNDAFVKGINRPEIVGILAEYTTLKEPAAYDQVKLAGLDPDGVLNVDTLREDFEWLKSIDQIPPGQRFPEQMFDDSLVREAVRILGPYR